MEDKTENTVPFIVFESVKTTMERTIRRLWILTIILVLLLFGSNAAWIYYENQFEDTVITQDVLQEADNGTNRFIGGDYYGEAESPDNG